MLTKELLKQVRQIEIKTKGLVNQVFSGEYHSVFKGRGMEFSEVREYQFGDDIRGNPVAVDQFHGEFTGPPAAAIGDPAFRRRSRGSCRRRSA